MAERESRCIPPFLMLRTRHQKEVKEKQLEANNKERQELMEKCLFEFKNQDEYDLFF